MRPKLILCVMLLFLSHQIVLSQIDKVAYASRISGEIKIDGDLSDVDWVEAKIITDFVQQEPHPSSQPSRRTEVKIIYDDKFIYVGATMYDDPDSVLKELVDRDQIGNADWFYVGFDPYSSGTNGVAFLLTAAGCQADARLSSRNEDMNWDAVWDSGVQITAEGWVAEMRIPYSALRFPDEEIQNWGFNMGRKIKRLEEKSWWAEINPNQVGFLPQFGRLEGIESINSPMRLSATPFVTTSYAINHDAETGINSSDGQLSGGLDIKYGVNDAFTIDMTAIPDFGQVQSDDQVLNLSPFEVRFDENRPFFTEGVELFSKGNIFHSRRVGDTPYDLYNIEDNISDQESIINNPQKARLINATKFSGRTNSGLGIGVFNAVERREYAEVMDTETGVTRTVRTNPLTNYNVLVLDQNLPNNSSISLINTNVLREENNTDANVTGLTTTLFTKSNSYRVIAGYNYSQRFLSDQPNEIGHQANVEIYKSKGKFRWGFEYYEESDHYNPNDLGFLHSPNERTISGEVDYFIFKPSKYFNRFGIEADVKVNRLYLPNRFVGNSYSLEFWSTLKNFWRAGISSDARPGGMNDYFEPRTEDFSAFYKVPANVELRMWVDSDNRKALFANLWIEVEKFNKDSRRRRTLGFNPRWRVSDRFTTSMTFRATDIQNEQGWVDDADDLITFGRRDVKQYLSGINARYTFTNNMNIDLRTRHNWTQVQYDQFSNLTTEGGLEVSDYSENHDVTFNSFSVDLVYRWRFLPGSDLFVTYKNNLQDSQEEAVISYTENFKDLFSYSQSNSISFKLIYYLDYISLKKKG